MQSNRRGFLEAYIYSKLALIILCIIILLLVPGVYNLYTRARESRLAHEAAVREYNDLQARENMLSLRVSYMKTERGREEATREKFNIAKEGEKFVVLVDKPVPASSTDNEANVFQALWNKFKGAF